MLTFLAPSGLLALLGVAVPVAIHLWNRKPGRTVQVGSIRWLNAAANRRLRNLKLEQLALLALRSLLVLLLALVIAQPVWRQPAPPRRGQVMVSPDLLTSESIAAVRPTIDSLRRRGYLLRQLGPGFPRISDTAWQQLPQPLSGVARSGTSRQFWQRVAQAADSFPGEPMQVYTSATQRHFRGARPVLPANVRWQTVPLPTTETTWLAGASVTASDSLRLVLSHGTDEAVYTTVHTVARPGGESAVLPRLAGLPLRYTTSSTGSFVEIPGPDSSRVPVQTQPLRVWLYYDADHALDARYAQAALQAAALGLAPRLELTVSRQLPPASASLDWLFWLHNASVPQAWQQRVAQGLHLWQDGRPPGTTVATIFAVTPHEQPYTLARLDTTTQPQGTILWQAANGKPVLTSQTTGRGTAYQFYSRLHPAWSSLSDSPDLPLLLLPVLQPNNSVAPDSHDPRQMDPAQVLTSSRAQAATVPPPVPTDTDVRVWLVVATAGLWVLERLIAARISSFNAATA